MFQTLHEISKNLIFVFVWKYVWKYVNINVSDITGNVYKSYMFWYNVISNNPSYYFKMYISEITNFLVNCIIMNFHQIFNHGHF